MHVWSGYNGTGPEVVTRALDSRAALGKLRSDLAMSESMLALEKEKAGRETAHVERDRAAQRAREEGLEAQRRAARERRARGEAMRKDVFGEGCLFARGVIMEGRKARALASVELACFAERTRAMR